MAAIGSRKICILEVHDPVVLESLSEFVGFCSAVMLLENVDDAESEGLIVAKHARAVFTLLKEMTEYARLA